MNRLEQEWWDRNVGLIERMWAMPTDVREVARGLLAARMRRFFGRGRILEIACGSGWPGRMIAGDGISVVGIDFSAEQVRVARAEAAAAGLASVCAYEQRDMNDALNDGFDGALVHAALHHLADDELEAMLDRLAASPPGFRIFLYEPVFPRTVGTRVARALVARALSRWLAATSPPPDRYRYDAGALAGLDDLVRTATAKGWFFSPKEVPFDEEKLESLLRPRFIVEDSYPVHFWALGVAQRVGLIVDSNERRDATQRYLAPALRRDALLLRTGTFRLFAGRYAFFAYELVVPASAHAGA